MTRQEVAKALGIKYCTVESIERTAFKKILRNRGLCNKCVDILAEIDAMPVEAEWVIPDGVEVEADA